MSNNKLLMKTVNITFETKEHEQLTEMKKNRSWRRYILELAGVQTDNENE